MTNLTSGGTIQQLIELVGAGVLPPFCNLLEARDWNTIIVVLDGLTNILHGARQMGELERIVIMIEETGGLDKLEALQHHENEQIYQKSMAMIDTFFSGEVCIYYMIESLILSLWCNFDDFDCQFNERIRLVHKRIFFQETTAETATEPSNSDAFNLQLNVVKKPTDKFEF